MTWIVLVGAGFGAGVWLLVALVVPRRTRLAVAVGRYDATRRAAITATATTTGTPAGGWQLRLGGWAARQARMRGWHMSTQRADLALLDRRMESHLATKLVSALAGLALLPVLVVASALLGLGIPVSIPVLAAVVLAVVGFLLPERQLRRDARQRRREFLHALTAFYDLVAMGIAGGRAVTQAMPEAARIGTSWSFALLAETITRARQAGTTPWQELGELGTRVGVPELEELEGGLALVADDGAMVRQSLAARASSLRAQLLTDEEGQAGERESSMSVAQFLLVGGFVVFLLFPALWAVLQI